MLSGQRFHLVVDTLGIETFDDADRHSVKVPAGEIITILSGPRPDDRRMVDVQWGDKKLVMFVEDVQKRGDLVKGKSA